MLRGKRPIIIGIVGDSAAGKTTISRGLVQLLGPERVTHVCTDDYHKFDRRERAQLGITALHPDCNYLDVMELHLERLHYGQPILKLVYDHSTGTLVRPEYVQPKQFVIVEGLLGFHTAVMRQFYDVKVYLDPPEELRAVWKIKRDTAKRGYTPEQVRAELVKREPDSRDFIRPQRKHADIVVQFYPPPGVAPEAAGPILNVRLTLRPTIPHPDLAYLVDRDADHVAAFVCGWGARMACPPISWRSMATSPANTLRSWRKSSGSTCPTCSRCVKICSANIRIARRSSTATRWPSPSCC